MGFFESEQALVTDRQWNTLTFHNKLANIFLSKCVISSLEDYVLTLNTYSYLKLLFFTLQVTVVLLVGTKMTARLKNAVL